MLTAEQILNLNDCKLQEVEIPEWQGSVFVRTMDGKTRDWFEAELRKPNPQNIRAKVASATICDSDGKLLFTESQIDQLAKKNYSALDRIAVAAVEVNEITEAAIENLKKT